MGLRVARSMRSFDFVPVGLVLAGAFVIGACERAGRNAGELYVTSGQTDEVVRLDARDGTVIRRIPVDRLRVETDEPHAVAVSADGHHWYVTVAHGEPSLWKFEVDGDRLIGRIDLPSGGAAMIGMSPDGGIAYVPDYDRAGDRVGRVAAVRLHDLVVTGHAPVCGAPHDAAVHPDGARVAVACAGSDEVVLLDARTLAVRQRVPVPSRRAAVEATAPDSSAGGHGHTPGRGRPMSVAWSPDGSVLAVALHAANAVWTLDRHDSTIAVIPIGAGPAQIVFVDESTAVTANRMDGSMSVIDVKRGDEVRRVPLDVRFPHGVVVGSDRRIAYISYEGTPETEGGVVAVDVESGEILWRRAAGRYVLSIAYLPN